ncbi:VgrG-related protein [Saccharothrix yanglingensis]|uniref:Type IV secretion protein Rhs n=1 Tax=Saccharothrix yanglingensis TaxID=659496 RepID=A0ABU0WX13_9PSEU|nr:VgrG-related protein [Saccharothrix yanglingensis]MDQ2584401.1 type IV secretion protein Rhs [Saccharothrix yanglingensis]
MSQVGRSFAASFAVKAGGLPESWQNDLVGCVVDENAGLPDAAVLTYRDPHHEVLAKGGITIGTKVEVSVTTVSGGAAEVLFTGEVTALEVDADSTGSFTVIRAMNKAHRLFRGRRVAAFTNATVRQVVREVVRAAGLRPGRIDVPVVTYPHLSQPGISDWDFLQLLAQEHGAVVRVDARGVLDFVRPAAAAGAPSPGTSADASPFVLQLGRNLMSLRASLTSADQVAEVEVRGWNVRTKKAAVGTSPAIASRTAVPGMRPGVVTAAFGKAAKALVFDTPYGTDAEAKAVARSLAAAVSAGFAEIEAVAEGEPKLRAGVPVAVGGAGTEFDGKYTATSVRHELDPHHGYRSVVTVSTSPDRSLAGLAMGANATARPIRMPGLATGVVTDIGEVGGERGWVKLTFPWLDDAYVTDWVRTVQLGGVRGGGVFSPEVNDEVLVGFEQGSLDRPYVLGGLYNGVDKPSRHDVPLVDPTSGRVNRRSLVSRTGNRLELLDGRTASGVRIASGDQRLEIRLDELTGQVAIEVRGGRHVFGAITLDRRGITVDAKRGDLVLKGNTVSVEATTGLALTGADVAVEGVRTEVVGRATAVVKGAVLHLNPPFPV